MRDGPEGGLSADLQLAHAVSQKSAAAAGNVSESANRGSFHATGTKVRQSRSLAVLCACVVME